LKRIGLATIEQSRDQSHVDRSDEQRIRNNVDGGFRAILDQIAASPPRKDVEGKIQVAFEVWQVRQYDLAISLLLDALIKQREGG
jgi:hypothetical protein